MNCGHHLFSVAAVVLKIECNYMKKRKIRKIYMASVCCSVTAIMFIFPGMLLPDSHCHLFIKLYPH